MYYKIVESFGPDKSEAWKKYIEWRGLRDLTSFQSIDGGLRQSLFHPESEEDWRHCLSADFRTDLITSLDYARMVLAKHDKAELIGVTPEVEANFSPEKGLLGYDILDCFGDISLLTNWGDDENTLLAPYITRNALVLDLSQALELRDTLRRTFPEDGHADKCDVWAVYKIDASEDAQPSG